MDSINITVESINFLEKMMKSSGLYGKITYVYLHDISNKDLEII